MKGLTERQKEILEFIEQFIENKSYSPSYREIGTHFGFSSMATVYKHIQTLKRKGALDGEKAGRTLAVLSKHAAVSMGDCLQVPLFGDVSAGQPIQTYSKHQSIAIPQERVRFPERTYALRAVGHAFNEEMIADGDLLLVEVGSDVPVGATILGVINGQNTVIKKYERKGEYIHLSSITPAFHPIIVHQDDLLLVGSVVGLIRSY